MSRILYFDCASGVSGDMLLGALVDLGLPIETLREALATLPLTGYRVEASTVRRGSLKATKVDVIVEDARGVGSPHPDPLRQAGDGLEDGRGAHGARVAGGAGTAPVGHAHEVGQGHGHGGDHHHRGLSEILGILERSSLESAVKARAAAMFQRLAEVEAAVHGTAIEKVHFHEVGAVDSIVDIVGAAFGLAWLKAERVVASPLNLGSGTITIAHGTLPVPAPATAQLVKGVPVEAAGDGELTTPTGALVVTSHAQTYGALPAMRIERVGYGAGSRETSGRPNVLRLIVGEGLESTAAHERVLVLETEIDDMSPQLYGPLMERLLAAGAYDAYYTPIFMKKGRPGIQVTVLADAARRLAVEEVLFRETTTIGVRWQEWQRSCLGREIVTIDTAYGRIRVKRALANGRVVNAQPEFDDCEAAAKQAGVAVKEVWTEAVAAYRRSADKG